MQYLDWIVQNKSLIKIFYASIVILICAIITIKSDKLYKLSLYQGIRYFRNAFAHMQLQSDGTKFRIEWKGKKWILDDAFFGKIEKQLLYAHEEVKSVYNILTEGS